MCKRLGTAIGFAFAITLGFGLGCSDSAKAPTSFRPTAPTPSAPTPPTQGRYIVTGRIIDAATNSPLAAANVEWAGLAEAWGDRGHGVVSKADGSYELVISGLGGPGSEQGLVNIRAVKAGYVEKAMKVTLSPVTTIDFALSRPQ